MTIDTITTLRTYWDSLCDKGEVPLRSEINPRAVPDVLDTLFVLERLNPEDVRCRIAGLTICEMMGMEVRGLSPMTFFNGNTRARFAAVMNDVMSVPKIARLGLETTDKLGNSSVAEMILLPLRSDFGEVSRIIGCVTPPSAGFTAPVRFHIRTVDLESISLKVASQPNKVFGFAEPRRGFIMDGAPTFSTVKSTGNVIRSDRKSGHLKIVN